MTAVRATTDACAYVRKVFNNRGLPFEERDVFIHKEHQKEMQNRLGRGLSLPQVIIDGIHIGVCVYSFILFFNTSTICHRYVEISLKDLFKTMES